MKKLFRIAYIAICLLLSSFGSGYSQSLNFPHDKKVLQWMPVEWNLVNSSWDGNPFDLHAKVTFKHLDSDEIRITEMFYNGGNTWGFRFTGTRPGSWLFKTNSDDPDLDGIAGSIEVTPNPESGGFVIREGNKWARQGNGRVFAPQYVMYYGPKYYYKKPAKIDKDIRTFLIDHGFTGFHTPVLCSWFDLKKTRSTEIRKPNPDIRTFEALELLIKKVYAAGGAVHIWAWGDEQRKMTPAKWGINGSADRRLQRYVAARLGPIPGWTMGYGFDLQEWVTDEEVDSWAEFMNKHLGWPHLLGGRGKFSKELSYSGYDQHKPTYETYVQAIESSPGRPSFSEDRFRVRNKYAKDYTLDDTRRGLWRSSMAGGVANIWGYLLGRHSCRSISKCVSGPYPNKEQIKTYFSFFDQRFLNDMIRCNKITDGFCLKNQERNNYIFYKENTLSINMDLSEMKSIQKAVAVDLKKKYKEIDLKDLKPTNQSWLAPLRSDWAISVEQFN